jgi:hypothetical protein
MHGQQKESPGLLILVGQRRHKKPVILYARVIRTHMLNIPPHTTYKSHPPDRILMKPFLGAYKQACASWTTKYEHDVI